MLLQITDEYAIESDANCWAIAKKVFSERDGHHYRQIAWYSTLDSAVNGLSNRMIRLSGADNLQDAIKDVNNISRTITKALSPKYKINEKE